MKTETRLNMSDQPASPPPAKTRPRPAPSAGPSTQPAPSRLYALTHNPRVLVLAAALALMLVLDLAHRHVSQTPEPPALVSAGAARGRELGQLEGKSLKVAAQQIRDTDRPLDEIRTEHVKRSGESRDKAFDARFVEALDAIIPPGTDKPSKEQRVKYAAVLEAIADGEIGGAP